MLNSLTFLHRWVGVALALFMLIWFATGLSIAFLGSPNATRAQQLAHAVDVSPEDGWLSLADALSANAKARPQSDPRSSHSGAHDGERDGARRGDGAIVDARLARVAGLPVWIVEDERGRRRSVSAIDGTEVSFSPAEAARIARAWLGSEPGLSYLDTVDAPVGVRNPEALSPFHRFAVDGDSGTSIVVSQRTGAVVQVATRADRPLIARDGRGPRIRASAWPPARRRNPPRS